jgi:hypothetical protein
MYPQHGNPYATELTTAGFQDLHTVRPGENAIKAEEQLSSCELSMWLCGKQMRPGAKNEFRRCKKTRSFNYQCRS